MYNQQYGILFKLNPVMQCILGKFSGWVLVLEAHNNIKPLKEDDKILFTYSKPTQFNKLVKHIKKVNNNLK
ncbi:hypothetical protein RSJ2_4171 (plasmid) [Clostridium botulinum]|uniref:hypothetical protein n=1 Tax=Clostridium botulinum TaxID=1491 RepID=UPI000464EF1B|nr:hypothetical protein [Clostridium botulinum]APR02536.1 hypothetical protein RSJ2_4171 [Clostridium botulinum]MBN3352000.1 hypothetical protein [Clostridium botulinum]